MGDFLGPSTVESSIAAAAYWIRDLLTGSIAATIAVVAIATLGFAMLQGHMPWRSGGRIVIGCFILFGAPTIAAGLMTGIHPSGTTVIESGPVAQTTKVSVPTRPPVFDPYAGASVPN